MGNLDGDCDNCILQLDNNCTRSLKEKVPICRTLKNRQRVEYAQSNGLLSFNIEGHFTQIFWSFHNPIELAIPLLCLKDAFKKKGNLYDYPEFFVRKTLFIEILMKFCKIAEDIGAMLTSYDTESINFTYKYIHYGVGDVINFYDSLNLNNDQILNYFNYPTYEEDSTLNLKLQDSARHIKVCLRFAKENYLELRELYNAYKHGFRINISQQGHLIEKKLNLDYEEKFSIWYFNSKDLRYLLGPFHAIEYKTEDMDYIFSNFFINSIKLLFLTQIFMFNYENMLYPDKYKRFKIFPTDLDSLVDSDFNILNKIKQIKTIIL